MPCKNVMPACAAALMASHATEMVGAMEFQTATAADLMLFHAEMMALRTVSLLLYK